MDEHNYDVAGQRLVEAAHYIETLLRVLPPRIKNGKYVLAHYKIQILFWRYFW